MDELQDLRAEMRRLNDRFEIAELFHRYAAAMDTPDREAMKRRVPALDAKPDNLSDVAMTGTA